MRFLIEIVYAIITFMRVESNESQILAIFTEPAQVWILMGFYLNLMWLGTNSTFKSEESKALHVHYDFIEYTSSIPEKF